MRQIVTLDVIPLHTWLPYANIVAPASVSNQPSKGDKLILPLPVYKKADTLAESLAEAISKRYPPVIANNPEQVVSQKRIAEILDNAFAAAGQFRRENRLGLLGRAKLASAFKGRLRELGYDEEFVGMASGRLAKALSGIP